MAGYDDDEDQFWDDDDLDAIPGDQLQELENNAIQFTQHQTQAGVKVKLKGSASDYGDEFEDDDLDDAVVYDETQGVPQQLQARIPGPSTQREQFRQERYGEASNVNSIPNRPVVQQWKPPVPRLSQTSTKAIHSVTTSESTLAETLNSGPDVDALQKQIQDLLRAQQALKQDLSARTGEIAIVRSKQEKQAKEHERELASIRKLNAERIANQQKAIEASREAEKTVATELEFVKKDLVEEHEKVRTLRRTKNRDKPTTGETVTTPKKNKTAVHRDGFDDDEIQLISPSKFMGRRSNGGTPTKAGAKRKRKAYDSPVAQLDVEQEELVVHKALPSNAVVLDDALIERIRRPDDRLTFLEKILDHQSPNGRLKTMEEFAKLTFSDSKEQSFASMVLSRLPTMKQSAMDFPIDFCELIISMWSQCLQKEFYTPIYLLVDLLEFALELKTLAIAPFIIDSLLPVAQSTADLIAIRRFKREKYTKYEKDIDVTACLELVFLAAQGCMGAIEHTIRFWRLLRLDFVLMILSQHQRVVDFDIMLRMLAMSVMRDSIGPKAVDQDTQQDQVQYIIDRMSLLLVTLPTVEEGKEKHDLKTISSLRLQILRTFEAFCQTTWGGEAVALHRYAIGRLVKVMSDELDTLYDFHSGHKLSARLVCLSTRILHYLVTKHDRSIKMQEKLSVIHGGNQKYLIGLARLNFAEDDLVLEADIDPEVSECAHEMLELAVTPEEGEAIHSAFSGV